MEPRLKAQATRLRPVHIAATVSLQFCGVDVNVTLGFSRFAGLLQSILTCRE